MAIAMPGTMIAESSRMEIKPPVDHADAKAAQARLEAAKESLTERFEELHRRFNEAKHKLSLPEQIVAHPWPAVGIALAVGALLGFSSGGKRPAIVEKKTVGGRITEALLGIVGTLALKMIREMAVKQFGGAAKEWWDQNQRPSESSTNYTPAF
ncbi:MAG: hypothetical protein JWO36_77 [Myxococcales bacterium]|nr:hypothetical protein [Myxococcales bacterium]